MPQYQNNDPFEGIKDEINRNSKDHTDEFDPQDIKTNSVLAAVCYIPFLFFLPFILKPDSRFARFHANQGLIYLIISAVLGAVEGCLWYIPIIARLINAGLGLVSLAFFLYGFINALNGKAKELPFVGGFKIFKY